MKEDPQEGFIVFPHGGLLSIELECHSVELLGLAVLDLFDFNHVELLSHLGRCQASMLAVVVVVEADGAIALESETFLDVRWGK